MSKTRSFPVQVKATTDGSSNVTPLAIYWDDEPYPVEVLSQRELDTLRNNTGNGLYFRVRSCGNTYGLIYNRTDDRWALEVQRL